MQKTQPYCRFLLLLVLFILSMKTVIAQNNPTPFSYEEQWSKVKKQDLEIRPKWVLNVVDTILNQAKLENNTVQIIKSKRSSCCA